MVEADAHGARGSIRGHRPHGSVSGKRRRFFHQRPDYRDRPRAVRPCAVAVQGVTFPAEFEDTACSRGALWARRPPGRPAGLWKCLILREKSGTGASRAGRGRAGGGGGCGGVVVVGGGGGGGGRPGRTGGSAPPQLMQNSAYGKTM